MKTLINLSSFLILALLSLVNAYAEEKHLVPFKVTGTDQTSVALLVPKDTTTDQYVDLVTAISCSRKSGKLAELGIPPTTPQGKKGKNAIMQIYIFNDPAWAIGEKINKWIQSDEGSTFSSQFGQKVQAYYYYTILGDQEQASIGFADGGRPFSRTYKSLIPISSDLCSSTQYIPAGAKDADELKIFMDSDFVKNFGIRQTEKWALRTGGQNISFKSDSMPTLSLSVEQSQKALTSFSAIFYIGYALGEPEWKVIQGLAETVLPKDFSGKALAFAKVNMEKKIKEKRDPNNSETMSMDSYYTLKLKGYVIRAGKNGQEPTFIIEKEDKL